MPILPARLLTRRKEAARGQGALGLVEAEIP